MDRISKKCIFLFLNILLLCCAFTFFFIVQEKLDDGFNRCVSVVGENDVIIRPFSDKEGRHIFVLPASWDIDNLSLRNNGLKEFIIADELITNGIHAIKISFNQEYETSSGETVVFQETSSNSLFIDTKSGSIENVNRDKNNKESGTVVAINSSGEEEYNGKMEWIHGRGNATWKAEKKPYNVKLTEKTSLFGLNEANKFVLLANCYDYTNMRNWMAYRVATDIGLPYSANTAFASVYFNGEYQGLYLVTDKIDLSESSVNITNLEKKNSEINHGGEIYRTNSDSTKCWAENVANPEDNTGGYLLEFCYTEAMFKENSSGFISDAGQRIGLKSPEYASYEQVAYIRELYQDFEDALMAEDGYNKKGQYYLDYIDLDSFVRYYLVQEVLQNQDTNKSSLFFYKDSDSIDGKIYAGPVWDFDVSMGRGYSLAQIPESLYAAAGLCNADNKGIFAYLCRHTDFVEAVKKEYATEFRDIVYGYLIEKIEDEKSKIYRDVLSNELKWRLDENLFQEELYKLVEYMEKRMQFFDFLWLNDSCAKVKVYVDYAGNSPISANGLIFVVKKGTAVYLPDDIVASYELLGYEYLESGEVFDNGTVVNEDIYLKAQWKISD